MNCTVCNLTATSILSLDISWYICRSVSSTFLCAAPDDMTIILLHWIEAISGMKWNSPLKLKLEVKNGSRDSTEGEESSENEMVAYSCRAAIFENKRIGSHFMNPRSLVKMKMTTFEFDAKHVRNGYQPQWLSPARGGFWTPFSQSLDFSLDHPVIWKVSAEGLKRRFSIRSMRLYLGS